MIALLKAQWRLELDRQESEQIEEDFGLGLGGSLRDVRQARERAEQSGVAVRSAEETLAAALEPIRTVWLKDHESEIVTAWLEHAEARIALAFWNEQLETHLAGLEGEAAAILAEAQARRWQQELRAAGEVSLLQNERYAYAAAPEIYKARSYLQVLVNGISNARKYFLAFEPRGRKVHIRLETQEQARPDLVDIPTEVEP